MKLIETKCPNCNSNIEVESNRRRAECQYCGTKFLLDDNTVNVKHINAGQITDEQEFINAETNLNKFKNYEEAYSLYLSLSKRFVDNPEIWIGLLRSITHDFKHKINSSAFQKNYTTYWNNFCSLVDREEVNKYSEKYRTYLESVEVMKGNEFNSVNNNSVAASVNKQPIVKNESCLLIVTAVLGMYGVHKFLRGNIKMGLIYLFTGGLFCVGWIYDIVQEYKKFPNSGQIKAIPWVCFFFLLIISLVELPYSFLSFLFLIIAAILCLDFFWNGIKLKKIWARITFPILFMFIGVCCGPQVIPESSYGKWVSTDESDYPIIELYEHDSKVLSVNNKYFTVDTFYKDEIIFISDSYDIDLKLKYDSSKNSLCLLGNDDKCVAKYYLEEKNK